MGIVSFTPPIYGRGWYDLLFTIDRSPCLFCALTLSHSSISHLALLSYAFANKSSSIPFLTFAMAHIKSTARLVGYVTGSGGEAHESEGSAERMEFVHLSDPSFHSGAGDNVDEGSHTWSYYFGPSTVMVNRIRGMTDNDYFAKGMGREPRVETVLKPNADEAVVFEEFFIAGLRMSPNPVLADILMKFQVQIP
jgi:hypothetical protein